MVRRARGVVAAAVLTVATASGLASTTAAQASPSVRDAAAALAVPAGAVGIGPVPSSQSVSGEVALSPADPAALEAFATAVSTPGSPQYRHFLGAGQFGSRFGASPGTLRAVRSWLSGAGLQVRGTDPDDLYVRFSGSAATVTSALGLSLGRYRLHDTSGFAATGTPIVPAPLVAKVRAVVGLSSLGLPHPRIERGPGPPSSPGGGTGGTSPPAVPHVQGGPTACTSAANAASAHGGYTDTQVASVYGLDGLYGQGVLGAGVTVALYELEPFSSTDVSTFESCYGISTSVTPVAVNGGAGSGSGSGEAALDVEQLVALAPQASVLVYEGPSASQQDVADLYQRIADDDSAQVVSTSWGLCEQGVGSQWLTAQSGVFEQMAAQGQSMFAAAGDSGAEDCYSPPSSGTFPAVDDPASQPDVTGVGATSMTSLSPRTEAVWNDCQGQTTTSCSAAAGTGAGGGGVSYAWSMPAWQRGPGVVNADSTGAPCGNSSGLCREVPDVAATGDPNHGVPIYFASGGGWIVAGGTSAAVVVWAGVAALLDEGASPGRGLGAFGPVLYAAAACPNTFHDVTSGNNDFTGNPDGLFPATAAYDMASGWGSPDAGGLLAALTDGCVAANQTGGSPARGAASGPSQFVQSSSFVVDQPDGSPSVFVRGAGGSLLNYWYVNGVWNSATVTAGGVGSDPVAVLQADGSPSVFFAGAGGSLVNYWYVNGVWDSAQVTPSGVASIPVVMLQGNGAPTVFVRTAGNALLNYFYIPSSGEWGAGTVAGPGSAFSAPAAMDQLNGAPTLVVEGPANSVVNYWYIPSPGMWGAGTVAGPGSAYADPGVLPQTDGAPSVLVQGPGNAVLNFWYIASQGAWGAGTVAPQGSAFSAPGVILQIDGASPSLVVEGPGNALLNYWYIPSQGIWGAGTVAGQGSAFSAPGVVAQPDGGPSVFVAGPGGSLFNYWYIAAQGAWGAAEVAAGGLG